MKQRHVDSDWFGCHYFARQIPCFSNDQKPAWSIEHNIDIRFWAHFECEKLVYLNFHCLFGIWSWLFGVGYLDDEMKLVMKMDKVAENVERSIGFWNGLHWHTRHNADFMFIWLKWKKSGLSQAVNDTVS